MKPSVSGNIHNQPIRVKPDPFLMLSHWLKLIDCFVIGWVFGLQEQNKPSASFENYKKFVTNTPFYGAKKEARRSGVRRDSRSESVTGRERSGSSADSSSTSAFESYRRSSQSPAATLTGCV